MIEKINTGLLCVILIFVILFFRSRPSEVGRFQWIGTPIHVDTPSQLALDTKTGERCWVWLDPNGDVQPAPPVGFVLDQKPSPKVPPELRDIQACSELAKN
jgi:hypothetical protein